MKQHIHLVHDTLSRECGFEESNHDVVKEREVIQHHSLTTTHNLHVTTLGATWSEKPVASGVPQGSILGSTLFLLYVNDPPDAVKDSATTCFADDTKHFCCVNTINDAQLLQHDLCNLEHWSSSSGINFNEQKCKCLRVTRKTRTCRKAKNSKQRLSIKIWVSGFQAT